ncbi:hypothetical protein ACFLU1_06630 [Chloroflexota bacterium]
MKKCPNCDRETMRTEDWSCQWCNFPLLSGAYKKISMTYRELREERLPQRPVIEDVDTELEMEEEPESMLEEEPEMVLEAELEPVVEEEPETVMEAEPEPVAEEEPEPVFEVEPEPVAEEEPESVLEAEPEPVAESKPRARRKPAAKRKSASKSKTTTEAKSPKPVTKPKPTAKTRAAPKIETEPAPDGIELTVSELLSAFEAEGEAANARFTNQIIRITGEVSRIEVKDILDIYYVTLKNGEENLLLLGVRCVFDKKYGPELSKLETGQTVTVQGKYDGSMIDVSLRNCVLIR